MILNAQFNVHQHYTNYSLFLISKDAQATFAEKSQIKINRYQKQKCGNLIHTLADIAFLRVPL